MAERIRRKPWTEYREALDGFTDIRRKMNKNADENPSAFLEMFEDLKQKALYGDTIAMDVLAYYYKSGVRNILPENYMRYISWEFLAAARGNELAIEKLQFLIGQSCQEIADCDSYQDIEYKNDIDEFNILYVLGKNLCKIMVKDFLLAFPVDLVKMEDDYKPFTQEAFIKLRESLEAAIPKTIDFMKS